MQEVDSTLDENEFYIEWKFVKTRIWKSGSDLNQEHFRDINQKRSTYVSL